MRKITRLAMSEFDKSTDISVRRSVGLAGSTLHGHDFYELDIVTGKSTPTVLNGREYTARRGTVFFMTPADFHEYAFEGGFDLYNIQFTVNAVPSETLSLISESEQRAFETDEEMLQRIISLTETMLGLDLHSKVDSEIASRLLECILLTLSKDTCSEGKKHENRRGIEAAISYLHAHFKENPTLDEVASTLSLSGKYFCKRFKEYTGQSYKEYLRAVKLRYARRLLMATELPVIEVAERCGYATQSHFNREFKDYYGTSPLKMRQNG